MLIDPVELVKIKTSLVRSIILRYRNVPLEFDDLYNEATIYSMLAVKKWKEGQGTTFHSFAYGFIRDYLRNYVNRKIVPNSFGTEERKRVGLDVSDLVYGQMSTKSFDESVEVSDLIERLKESCDDRDLEILDLMYKEGWGCTRIGRKLGCHKTSVNKRVQKMREKLLDLGY